MFKNVYRTYFNKTVRFIKLFLQFCSDPNSKEQINGFCDPLKASKIHCRKNTWISNSFYNDVV